MDNFGIALKFYINIKNLDCTFDCTSFIESISNQSFKEQYLC